MKVLCEIPLKVQQYEESKFTWLVGNENLLFVIEDGKRLRLIGLQRESPRELQTASLAEPKVCTSSSWNRNGSLIAIVVDKRQIYLWDIRANTFTYFKPQNDQTNNLMSRRNQKPGDIEMVAWSKQSERLAICYSTGQILLCKFVHLKNISEKFIDNCDSVLKRIVSIEVSEHADIFACLSIISEIVVMSFDGQTKFYLQGDNTNLYNMKFSPTIEGYTRAQHDEVRGTTTTQIRHQSIWLAYQSKSNGLFFKKISIDYDESFQDIKPELNILRSNQDTTTIERNSRLVDFFWSSTDQLIVCFSSGTIHLVQVKSNSMIREHSPTILKINQEEKLCISEGNSSANDDDEFKIFKLIKRLADPKMDQTKQVFALLAATSYKLFYYELYESKQRKQPSSFEHIDDIDLTDSLKRVNLELKRANWNSDCSLLALQLTSGQLLIYRTRLINYMVASFGPKTAYLSATNEITVLNYGGPNRPASDDLSRKLTENRPVAKASPSDGGDIILPPASGGEVESQSLDVANDGNALIVNVGLKPSLIAIGPKHLALALNNRIRLYSLSSCQAILNDVRYIGNTNNKKQVPYYEEEFVTVVVGLKLCSNFVATLFDDGRLKLQTIRSDASIYRDNLEQDNCSNDTNNGNIEFVDNERFFPDPAKPELITAFTLTNNLLVYCSENLNINIFCLRNWNLAQVCDHSKLITKPIRKLRANAVGNKFVCLLNDNGLTNGELNFQYPIDDHNVYLFDLYSNQISSMTNRLSYDSDREQDLFNRIFKQQLVEVSKLLPYQIIEVNEQNGFVKSLNGQHKLSLAGPELSGVDLSNVSDAIWDTDGRTLLLVETKLIHVVAILDHTLDREPPIVQLAGSTTKSSNYSVLYVTQGIVSHQSSLGRVMNSILETHDDELRLIKLERQIQTIKDRIRPMEVAAVAADDNTEIQVNSSDDANTETYKRVEANLSAQCDIMLLKLAYLRTILPIYPLTKCRDICNHLMNDEQLNLPNNSVDNGYKEFNDNFLSSFKLINQLVWRQLAAWAIYCSNLNFALSIYREHGILYHSSNLEEILQDLRLRGRDSKQSIKARLLSMLSVED